MEGEEHYKQLEKLYNLKIAEVHHRGQLLRSRRRIEELAVEIEGLELEIELSKISSSYREGEDED